jgi:hypothetical protein
MISTVLRTAAKACALVSSTLDRTSELAARLHGALMVRALARDPKAKAELFRALGML